MLRYSVIPILSLGLGFHPDLTAISNIYQSSILLGFKKEDIAKRVDEIIKFAELERFADTKVKNFSSWNAIETSFCNISISRS